MKPNSYIGIPFKPREITARRLQLERQQIKRQTVINDEDILNLKIALGATKDVNDFIRSI